MIEMNVDDLITWIEHAEVENCSKNNKNIFVAVKDNQQLFFYGKRNDDYSCRITVLWLDGGDVQIIYQDLGTHSTGNLTGDFTPREGVESIYVALHKYCLKDDPVYD